MPPPWDDVDYELSQASEQAKAHGQEYDWEGSEAAVVPAMSARPAPPEMQVQAISVSDRSSVSQDNELNAESKSDLPVIPVAAPKAMQLMPMAELDWDGHWPNLAAALSVRGVAQQLAQQSELRACSINGNAVLFKLCVPFQTLLSAGSAEKLTAALNERFADFKREIRVEVEIGAVEQTANAQAVAERAEKQVQAEQAIHADGFVQILMRDFGASILTGSIRSLAVV